MAIFVRSRGHTRLGRKDRMLAKATVFILSVGVWSCFQFAMQVYSPSNLEVSSIGRSVLHATDNNNILYSSENSEQLVTDNFEGRKLLSSGCSCPSIPDWVRYQGGVLLYLIGVLYTFLGLAIVCDEFFVASLELISERLELSEDVAGATFMAAGSSAPELFTSLTSLFNPDTSDSMGTAAIVGSAVFNVLVIIGVTGIFAGRTLSLDWKPLCRDGFFYASCIILLLVFFEDGVVEFYEAVFFVLGYFGYVTFMKFNARVFVWLDSISGNKVNPENGDAITQTQDLPSRPSSPMRTPRRSPHRTPSGRIKVPPPPEKSSTVADPSSTSDAPACSTTEQQQHPHPHAHAHATLPPLEHKPGSDHLPPLPPGMVLKEDMKDEKKLDVEGKGGTPSKDGAEEGEDDPSPFDFPADGSFQDKFLWAASQPFHYIFWVTIPDCRVEKLKEFYMATFLMSILWIAALSYFMVDWTNVIGCVIGMPPVAMGVTVLAAGTSIPDALGSLAVAREGQGDMAVANAIGSNVFDILLGLGLPWLIAILMRDEPIEVEKGDLLKNIIFLFAVLVIYFSLLFGNKLQLTKAVGMLLCGIYGLFVIYTIVWNLAFEDGDCRK